MQDKSDTCSGYVYFLQMSIYHVIRVYGLGVKLGINFASVCSFLNYI